MKVNREQDNNPSTDIIVIGQYKMKKKTVQVSRHNNTDKRLSSKNSVKN